MPGDYRKRPKDGGVAGIHSIYQSQSVSDRINKNGSLLPKYSIYSIPANAIKQNEGVESFHERKKSAMKKLNPQNDIAQSQMSMMSIKNQVKMQSSWLQNGTFLPPNQGISGDQIKSQKNILTGNQEEQQQQQQEKKFQESVNSQSQICQFDENKGLRGAKKFEYNMQNLELCFRIEVIINNGQQKISIERGISEFAQLDQVLHRVINIQFYPAAIVGKLPELADINNSMTAIEWNQVLEAYLLALVKKQEFYIPQLFKFLGLAVVGNGSTNSEELFSDKALNQNVFRKFEPKRPSKIPSKVQQARQLVNIVQTQQSNHLSPQNSRKQSDKASVLNKRSFTIFSTQRKSSSQSQNLNFNIKRQSISARLRQNPATENRLIEFISLHALDYQYFPISGKSCQIQNFIFKFKISQYQAKKWIIQKRIQDFYTLRRQLAESLQKPLSQIPPLPNIPQFNSSSSRIVIPLMRGLQAFLMELMSNGNYCREPLLIFLQYTSRISHISLK